MCLNTGVAATSWIFADICKWWTKVFFTMGFHDVFKQIHPDIDSQLFHWNWSTYSTSGLNTSIPLWYKPFNFWSKVTMIPIQLHYSISDTKKEKKQLSNYRMGPPVISWFITPSKYSYKYHTYTNCFNSYNVRPPRKLSWFITPITMVYDTDNYSYWGL